MLRQLPNGSKPRRKRHAPEPGRYRSKEKQAMGLFDFLKQKKPEMSPELQETMQKVSSMAFPGGSEQIEEETGQLHALLRGRLNKDEAKRLLTRTKALLIIAQDHSEERITHSILAATGGNADKAFETFVIELRDGSERTIHFDISSFYGRF